MLPTRLAAFLAIARAGQMTRAARALHLTQPALSAQIARLEDELGIALFHRTARGMALTEAGALYRRYVEEAATWLEDGRRALEGLAALEHGTLSVGAGATAATYLLPPVVRAYHRDHPGIRLRLREQGSAAVADGVRAGDLDVGIVTLPVPDDRGLHLSPWRDDELLLIVPPDHPLADGKRFRWGDLDGEPFVLFESGSAVRRLIDDALRARGVRIEPAVELRSIASIKQLVAQGIGCAFVSRFALPAGVGLVPCEGDPPRRSLGLCVRADRAPSPAAAAFLDRLRSGSLA